MNTNIIRNLGKENHNLVKTEIDKDYMSIIISLPLETVSSNARES